MSWVKRELSPEKDVDTTPISKQLLSDRDKKEPSWIFFKASSPILKLDHYTDVALLMG